MGKNSRSGDEIICTIYVKIQMNYLFIYRFGFTSLADVKDNFILI